MMKEMKTYYEEKNKKLTADLKDEKSKVSSKIDLLVEEFNTERQELQSDAFKVEESLNIQLDTQMAEF